MKKEYKKIIEEQKLLPDHIHIANFNGFYRDGMMWFMLASYISAENFWDVNKHLTEKSYKDMLDIYDYNIFKLKKIVDLVEKTNIPISDQIKIREKASEGISILKKELSNKKRTWNRLHKKKENNIINN